MTTALRTLSVFLMTAMISSISTAQTPIEIITKDSVHVFGDVFASEADEAPVILLFHQAGANGPAEYGTIIPRLLEAGYSVVSVDQRSGGNRMGGTNRTVAAGSDREYSYCDVMPDLEATVDYAVEHRLGSPLFVWGSSYSAGLVVRLAAARPDDIDAALAFSPASGGPMADCSPNEVAAEVSQPLLILRPASEMSHESVAAQLELFESAGHQTYVSEHGVHGSSMLNDTRTGQSTDETWNVVLSFLASVSQP